jgi:hypothetical protein
MDGMAWHGTAWDLAWLFEPLSPVRKVLLFMIAQPGRCSSSATEVRTGRMTTPARRPCAYLPLVKLILLGLVLLDQVIENLL